jgi:NADH dehydrogenase
MSAFSLTAQVQAERDRSGRLVVDRNLRVAEVPTIFAAGDTAYAATDLLGVPLEPYRQKNYVTCLDLGPSDAVFTRGWDAVVELIADKAKAMKREINTQWIYPPRANRADAFKADLTSRA